ncbi:MAG TPA: hypothetical protein VGQ20_08500 [Acidimicrobiales bacterium]|nr:hypothetical protein [Acidimicrobiales bacterium]
MVTTAARSVRKRLQLQPRPVAVLVLSVAATLVSGCGGGEPAPPLLVLIGTEGRTELRPYSYCWSDSSGGVCADGVPNFAEAIESRGIELPRLRWSGGSVNVQIHPANDRTIVVLTAVLADGEALPGSLAPGEYDVYVDGRPGPGKDAAFAFRLRNT